jgi:integrase
MVIREIINNTYRRSGLLRKEVKMAYVKKRKSGKVQITVTDGKKYDGSPKRFYRTVDYRGKRQLERDVADFENEIRAGEKPQGSVETVDQIYKMFMIDGVRKASTVYRYDNLMRNQISPAFGSRKITTITRAEIKQWAHDLLKELSPKSTRHAVSLLSSIFKYAEYELELIDKNPCEHIRLPKPAKKDNLYTEAETIRLMDCLSKEENLQHVTVIYMLLFTGMRIGEVYGLKWEDINWEWKSATIKRERIGVGGKDITDTPKTETSLRTISVPPFVLDMLRDLKSTCERNKEIAGSDYHDSGFVIQNAYGEPARTRGTYDWFKRFLRRHGLRDITLHDLRHTHAAMLSRMGVDIIDVSHRLGHANTRITQETYEYLFRSVDTDIADKLENFYENMGKIWAQQK